MQIENSLNHKNFIRLPSERKLNPLTQQGSAPRGAGGNPELHGSGQSERKMDSTRIEDMKLKKACQDFESIFLFHLLRTMRSTIPKDEFLEDDLGGDILTSVMDEELAKKIASRQGLGISDMLYKELSRSNSDKTTVENKRITQLDLDLPKTRPKDLSDIPTLEKIGRFEDYIHLAATKYEVSPQLIKAVIYHESGGNPKAVSPRGAKGLMQLVDTTAQEMGAKNVFDPKENILAGTKYLKSLLERFRGDVRLALAAYNAGPSVVEKLKQVPPFKETVNYVNKVLGLVYRQNRLTYGGEFAGKDK